MHVGVRGEDMIDPHPWRGDRVQTQSRNLLGMVIGNVVRRKGGTRTASGVDDKLEVDAKRS